MTLPTTLLVLATIALALSGADATLEIVCKAASNNDVGVNYDFCVKELGNHPWAHDTDAWGLAMQAADCGIGNAYRAIEDIEGMLEKPGSDAKAKEALGQCDGLYTGMKYAFANAHDWIKNRNYTAGKEEAEKVITLANLCDDILAKAAVPSPLTERSTYSLQIAIVCSAIITLI
ncbi:hypothetical protein ACQ4PT_046682 [Festuca glaucescens]